MPRKVSRFESLPLELRIIVYDLLFGKPYIQLWRKKQGNNYDLTTKSSIKDSCTSILRVSRQIHHEALPIFAAVLKLDFESLYLDKPAYDWQRVYYPLIRYLEAPTIGRHLNLSAFTSLRTLKLKTTYTGSNSRRQERCYFPLPSLDHLGVSDSRRRRLERTCLWGGLDERLKVARKQALYNKNQWVKKLINHQDRSFRLEATLSAGAPKCSGLRWPTLQITFDLDSMETISRLVTVKRSSGSGAKVKYFWDFFQGQVVQTYEGFEVGKDLGKLHSEGVFTHMRQELLEDFEMQILDGRLYW
jgi:hypothetical protein